MKLPLRPLLALLCSVVLAPFPSYAEPSHAELKKLQGNIDSVQREIRDYQRRRDTLNRDLRAVETEIGQLQRQISEVRRQQQNQQNELARLQQRRVELEHSKQEQQHRIGEQVAAAYQLGREKKLKLLLNQEEPEKLSRSVIYYDYFNRARTEQINTFEATLTELDSIEPAIVETTNALNLSKVELDRKLAELSTRKNERRVAVASVNKTLSEKNQQLSRLERDQKELESLLRKMEERVLQAEREAEAKRKAEALAATQAKARATDTKPGKAAAPSGKAEIVTAKPSRLASDGTPFRSLKGKLPWPTAGRRLNQFGQARPNSPLRWQGVTIAANEGQGVQSIHHGRVIFADWFMGKGLLIIVDHGQGYMSLYAHNQTLLKEPGEWVSAGETIAKVGNSGGLNQTALYFELRSDGRPINPAQWCRG